MIYDNDVKTATEEILNAFMEFSGREEISLDEYLCARETAKKECRRRKPTVAQQTTHDTTPRPKPTPAPVVSINTHSAVSSEETNSRELETSDESLPPIENESPQDEAYSILKSIKSSWD